MAGDSERPEQGVHIGWVLPPAAAALCLAYRLGALGPALLGLLCLPNVFGVHMLLSWQWVVAFLIAELADMRIAAPYIAAFGYCFVGCPYYILNANMFLRMRINLPDRVKSGWTQWMSANVFNLNDESMRALDQVLKRGSVTTLYKLVFLQFDLLCHLLPMIISLQRHAQSITPAVVGVMVLAFLCWVALLHRRHLQWLRPYETLRTWRLCLVPAPRASSLREHLQITYLPDPPITPEEQDIGVAVAAVTTGLLMYLTATERHYFISLWLAWGKALPEAWLQTVYGILVVTLTLTSFVFAFKAFFEDKRKPDQSKKAD